MGRMPPAGGPGRRAIERFVAGLRSDAAPGTFNPWFDSDPLDVDGAGATGRRARLRAHLDQSPRLILLGEACGYQGCHFSGIPFTSERLACEGRIPRLGQPARFSIRPRPWSEPSATAVWNALHALGLAECTLLWNAYAWHPYHTGRPYSNRTPTRAELTRGAPVLAALVALYPRVPLYAVGRIAERSLALLGQPARATLRHPSMGGATAFRAGLAEVASTLARPRARRRPVRS